MASSTKKVITGGPNRITGTVLYGPLGTTYPKYADAATAIAATPDVAMLDLGYVGADGVTKSESKDFSKIKEFGGQTIARMLNEYNAQFTVTLMEFNANVAAVLYGSTNVTVIPQSGAHGEIIAVRASAQDAAEGVWLLQLVGRNGQRTLFSIGDGTVTTVGDQAFTRTDAASHQITIETLPDADGYDFYMFVDDNVVAVTAIPTITSVLPTGRSIGGQVTIKGTRFAAGGVSIVTAVSIDGVTLAATAYTVIDANTIIATIPTGAVGASNVIVTNSTGASAPVNYTVV